MIIVRIIKLTIRILVLVVVVLMTILKIVNRRVKNTLHNTSEYRQPYTNECKRMIRVRQKEIQFLAVPYLVQELRKVDTI